MAGDAYILRQVNTPINVRHASVAFQILDDRVTLGSRLYSRETDARQLWDCLVHSLLRVAHQIDAKLTDIRWSLNPQHVSRETGHMASLRSPAAIETPSRHGPMRREYANATS